MKQLLERTRLTAEMLDKIAETTMGDALSDSRAQLGQATSNSYGQRLAFRHRPNAWPNS